MSDGAIQGLIWQSSADGDGMVYSSSQAFAEPQTGSATGLAVWLGNVAGPRTPLP